MQVPPDARALLAALPPRVERDTDAAELARRLWHDADVIRRAEARARLARLASLDIRLVATFDDEYPAGLRDLADAPRVLALRGAPLPLRERAVGIVGSRAASPYGLAHAMRLASDLARLGYAIVSGFARGIDAAAHRGALEAGGTTIAVLPGALDRPTPASHPELASAIVASGSFVSEHVWPIDLQRSSFVERNRLIAALASATVVVEASETSGALHTATFARRLGRAVLAVPGDLDRPTARGCHALLRAGATPCTCAADVVEAAAGGGTKARTARTPRRRRAAPAPPFAPAATVEARVLHALAATPETAETIARRANAPLAETLAALLALEWSGGACSLPGPRWARRSGSA